MAKERIMIKNMNKGLRMMKSLTARKKRKSVKNIISTRTFNLYSKLRRLRKKK